MSKTKFNPGPWKFDYHSVSGHNMNGSPQDAGWYTAGPAITEKEADAKLIAAAPDLLYALEWALSTDLLPHGIELDNAIMAVMSAKGLLEEE